MIQNILSFLTGGLIDKIASPLVEAHKNYLNAQNDTEKLLAEQRIKQLELEQKQRDNAKEIRLATSGFWEMRAMTFLIALPFVIHLWLVSWDTWDTSVNWGVPSFPSPFDEYQGLILLSFFGVTVIGTGIKSIAGAIAYKKK